LFLLQDISMHALLLAAAMATPALPLPQDQLWLLRNQIHQIQGLQSSGLEIDKDGKVVTGLLKKAHDLSGGQVNSYDDLIRITDQWEPPTSLWDKTKGWFTFVNIVLITSVILMISAVAWLFRLYFIWLITEIPAKVWNVILWIVCVIFVLSGTQVSPDYYLFLVLPGAIGMMATWAFTCYLYFEKTDDYTAFFAVLAAIWAVIALVYSSQVIGFMSMAALLSSLGFVCGMIPGVIWIGFERESVIPRATFAAGFMLLLHVLLTMAGDNSLTPFRPGMNFLGTFVFYLGLLIISNKWYCYDYAVTNGVNWPAYWSKQAFTVAMGVLALYLGTVYQMHTLLGVGGTFFYIYMLEKYYEIPWKGKGWAWSLLGLGIMLYCFSLYARGNPQYFFFMGAH
jgi:hypothetical protein